MNALDILNQHANKRAGINLEAEAVMAATASMSDEEFFSQMDGAELHLESQMAQIDAFAYAGSTYSDVTAIHEQQIEDDIIEDPVTTQALMNVLEASENEVTEFKAVGSSVEPTVALEAEEVTTTETTTTTTDAKASAESFKEKLVRWGQQMVEWLKRMYERIAAFFNNRAAVVSRMKDASGKMLERFSTGTKEYKVNIKGYSVMGDELVSGMPDLVSKVGSMINELTALDKAALNLANTVAPMSETTVPVFGGKLFGKDFSLTYTKSEVEKKDIETTVSESNAKRLAGEVDRLANLLSASDKPIKDVQALLKKAESELSKAGSAEFKESIKLIQHKVTFINTLYKTMIGQAKALTTICSMSPIADK